MANLYPEHLIEEIKQASDIVEVLSEFLKLKKRGTNYLCNCPFHTEKTPSFSVSPTKQIYHCFGCGKGGNVFTFLMEHENMSFIEAVKYLAKRANIKLPEKKVSPEEKSKFDQLFYSNQTAKNFYKEQLWQTENGHKVMSYLKTSRGLSEDTIRYFELGFAPEGWDNLINFARTRKISDEDLIKAGLAVAREEKSGAYDRFRRRLMFPIMNFTGKTIAFGGRALSKEDKAKYLNSPETELYNKSKVLYGLNYSRSAIRSTETALMVEGYMDFVSLWQAGFENLVAASGTAFTADQARLLARYAPTAIMLFDSDTAGISAARRCAGHLMSAEMDFRVIMLPRGEDPDSFVRKFGPEALQQKIDQALGFPEFIRQTLDTPFERMTPRQKEAILKDLIQIASQSSGNIRRELFLKDTARVFDINLDTLMNDLDKLLGKITEKQPESQTEQKTRLADNLQFQILAVLLENPFLLDKAEFELNPDEFSNSEYKSIYGQILKLKTEGQTVDASSLVGKFTDPEMQKIITRASTLELGTTDTEGLYDNSVMRLKLLNYQNRLLELSQAIKSAQSSGDEKKVAELSIQLSNLQQNNPFDSSQ